MPHDEHPFEARLDDELDGPPPSRRAPWRRLADPSVWVLVGIGALGATLAHDLADALFADQRERDLAVLADVADLVDASHVRPRAEGAWLDDALRGMLGALDPYSAWYDHEQAQALDRATSGAYVGLGVVFADVGLPHRVLFPLPGSPAEAAGIAPGDRFLALAGEPMPPDGSQPLEQRLADGRPVEVELEGLDGARRRVTLRPTVVREPSVHHVRWADGERRIGHVAIASFTRGTEAEFDAAVAALREGGLAALVLDLRGNRGGVLDAATAIANRFVADGPLVIIESRQGRETVHARRALASLAGLPLVVLVDRDSASASEVLAGALQDHRAGVLVGEPSYGKGTVQTLTRVPGAGGIAKLSTAVYRTPAGRLLERSLSGAPAIGLVPDVEVELEPMMQREVRGWLGTWGPPLGHVEALLAWERATGERVVLEPPPDPALEVALELLRGRLPVAIVKGDGARR